MENPEETLQVLDEWTTRRARSCSSGGFSALPRQLDEYLAHVARTGDPVFQWSSVKPLIKEKLLSAVNEFYETAPGLDVPLAPNVDPFNYEAMRSLLLERLDSFNAAPFTVQRLCELLTAPRKQYNRIDKFMRAIEKNVLVVSTREPGPVRREENEQHMERAVNGSDGNSDCGVDVDMEDSTWRDLRQPSVDPLAGVSHHGNEQNNETPTLPIETTAIPEHISPVNEDKMEVTPTVTTETAKSEETIKSKEETVPEVKELIENMELVKDAVQPQTKEQVLEITTKEPENTSTSATSSSEDDSNSNPEPTPKIEHETEREIETEQKPEATTSGEDSSSSNSSENTDGGGDTASRSPERSGMSEGDSSSEVPENKSSKQVIPEEKEIELKEIPTENYTIADIPAPANCCETKPEENIESVPQTVEENPEKSSEVSVAKQEDNIEVDQPFNTEQQS